MYVCKETNGPWASESRRGESNQFNSIQNQFIKETTSR